MIVFCLIFNYFYCESNAVGDGHILFKMGQVDMTSCALVRLSSRNKYCYNAAAFIILLDGRSVCGKCLRR